MFLVSHLSGEKVPEEPHGACQLDDALIIESFNPKGYGKLLKMENLLSGGFTLTYIDYSGDIKVRTPDQFCNGCIRKWDMDFAVKEDHSLWLWQYRHEDETPKFCIFSRNKKELSKSAQIIAIGFIRDLYDCPDEQGDQQS